MDLEPARLLCPWGFPGKISSSRGSSQPKDLNPVSCISRRILYHGVTWEALFLGQITFYACKCLFVQFGFLYFPLFWSKRKSESVICSAMSDSLRPQGLGPTRLLCPWDFPGNNTRVGCNFLLQGIFVTQGSNLSLLHYRWILYSLSHQRSPFWSISSCKTQALSVSLELKASGKGEYLMATMTRLILGGSWCQWGLCLLSWDFVFSKSARISTTANAGP